MTYYTVCCTPRTGITEEAGVHKVSEYVCDFSLSLLRSPSYVLFRDRLMPVAGRYSFQDSARGIVSLDFSVRTFSFLLRLERRYGLGVMRTKVFLRDFRRVCVCVCDAHRDSVKNIE